MANTCRCQMEKIGVLPLIFEENKGQYDQQVRFVANATGSTLFFVQDAIVVALRQKGEALQYRYIKIQLEGANLGGTVQGSSPTIGKHHYFRGSQPTTDVQCYGKLTYTDIYPGIDWIHYGNGKQLEYDFVVKPGVDAGQIRLSFQGVSQISLDGEGHLVLSGEMGEYKMLKPHVTVEVNGAKQSVACDYEIREDKSVGMKLESYDPSGTLTIDPILEYSSYLGGLREDRAYGIAVDTNGNACVVGSTSSPNFPTTPDAYDKVFSGIQDVFVTKFNSTGTDLVFSTYLGGTGSDEGYAIALDSSNNIYITGYAGSGDFPLINPFRTTIGGSAFIAKLDTTGSNLLYSTGIANETRGQGIMTDTSGNILIVGDVFGTNL
ncbi:MAG: SBBP repeat-containing protein, partial [Cellulosilyticaceae bacterium]